MATFRAVYETRFAKSATVKKDDEIGMKITKVTLWKLPLTSHNDYHMAEGKSCLTTDSMIVRIDTDTGLSGWGENCPIPHYLPAYAEGVQPALDYMMTEILGAEPLGAESLMAQLDKYLIGHNYAKSVLDMAFWDLTAKAAGMPLYALLGGRRSGKMPVYHSVTCIAPDEMAVMAKEAKNSGVTQFQVKLGADRNWEADVARIRLVREAVGPGLFVYADWNCGSNKLDAIRTARAVSDVDVMLEQPCETIEDCASVKRASGLAMKLDESTKTPADLLKAYNLDCLDATALKISKFGGLSAARCARDLCTYLGVKMCVEDTWGSDIVTAAALHLGVSTNPKFLLNVCDLSSYVGPRLDETASSRVDGFIEISDSIGLGVTPNPDILGKPVMVWG